MVSEHLNIKFNPPSYQKRFTNTFLWTILIYIILAIVVGCSTDLKGFLSTIAFLTALFIFDFLRRLRWVKYVISSLETNPSGIQLTYFEKDNLLSASITWNNLGLSKGATITRNPTKIISIKNGEESIGYFYASSNFENEKIDELYKKLTALKSANPKN